MLRRFLLLLFVVLLASTAQAAKPVSGTGLDTGHSLYPSIEAVWGMLEGTGTSSADSRNGHNLTTIGTGSSWATNGSGENVIDFAGTNNNPGAVTSPFTLPAATAWSIAWRGNVASSTTNFGMFLGDNTSINGFVWFAAGTGNISFRTDNGNTFDFPVTGANQAVAANYLLVRETSPSHILRLYRNGTEVSNQAIGSTIGALTINSVGNGYAGTTFPHWGRLEYVYVWSGRQLTSSDATTLNSNPYVIFDTGSPLTAGTASTTSVGNTIATVTSTAATGGTSPYTYQWHRSTTSGFTPSGGNAVSGATSLTLNDTGLTNGTTYYYKLVVTDNVAATATSNQTSAMPTAGTIDLTGPPQFKTFQRSGTTGTITGITGTYTGSPTSIEARFASSVDWEVIDAAPSGGTFSASLVGQGQGQGAVEVRFSNDTLVTDSVSPIRIGDVYLVVGDSNAEGRATNSQSYTHATLGASVYKENDTWADGVDPTDTGTANGSIWPDLATLIMADQGVPVAFITTGQGSSYLEAQWEDGSSLYNGAVAQANEAATGGIKGVLCHLGTNDAAAGTLTRTTFRTKLEAMADGFAADITGAPKTIPLQIGYTAAANFVRLAISDAWDNGGNIVGGPAMYDLDNTVHPASDVLIEAQAQRYYAALKAAFYGGTAGSGRGPQATSASYDGDEITVNFNQAIDAGLTLGSSVWTISDANSRTVSGVSYSGSAVTITASGIVAPPVTVSFGLGGSTAGIVVPLGPDITLPTSGTINLPAEPFEALSATAPVLTVGVLSVVSHTDTTVTLSWTGATGGTPPYVYDIEASIDGSGIWSEVAADVVSPHTVVGLTSNTTYRFRVTVTDSSPMLAGPAIHRRRRRLVRRKTTLSI